MYRCILYKRLGPGASTFLFLTKTVEYLHNFVNITSLKRISNKISQFLLYLSNFEYLMYLGIYIYLVVTGGIYTW